MRAIGINVVNFLDMKRWSHDIAYSLFVAVSMSILSSAVHYLNMADRESLSDHRLEAPGTLIKFYLADCMVNEMAILSIICVRSTC